MEPENHDASRESGVWTCPLHDVPCGCSEAPWPPLDWPACLKHGEGQEAVVHGQIVCGPCYVAEEMADAD